MFARSTVAVALLASFVAAQTFPSANNTIDPNSVDATTRAQWCTAQINTCSTLCDGDASPNDCDDNLLTFDCACASNNSAPGLQYYTTSLDTYICEQVYQNCIIAGANVKATQDKCDADEKMYCGHANISDFATASPSSSSSASSAPSSTGSPSSTPVASATTSTSTGAAATMLALGGEYGSGMVAAGVAAAFGLML